MATTLSTLSKKEFNSRVVSFISRSYISKYNVCEPRSSYRFDHLVSDIQRYARYGEEDGIPYSYENICYGLQWSIATGRLPRPVILALYALKCSELIALVFELGCKFDTISEIPSYLINKFGSSNEF